MREQQQTQVNLAKIEAYRETIAISQVFVSYLAKLNKEGIEAEMAHNLMQYVGIAATSSAIFGGLGGLAGIAAATFGGLAIAPLAGVGALLVLLGAQLAKEKIDNK